MNTGNTYRAEYRSPSQGVAGVYSWIKPDGNPLTISYASRDNQGYQVVPLNQLGIDLPPYPYSLYSTPRKEDDGLEPYGALNPANRFREKNYDDMVIVESSDDEQKGRYFFTDMLEKS